MNSWVIFTGVVIIYFTICPPAAGKAVCSQEDCVTPYKCEHASNAQGCGSSKICCQVVKSEYRTLCKQHGGHCTPNYCNPRLIRPVLDCPSRTRCCVLV